MAEIVSINGEILAPQNAKISVFDRGFLFGDGVYEVVRSYGKVLFTLEDHLDRLYRSAQRIDLDIGFDKEALGREIYRVFQKAQADDQYVRVIVTRGEGPRINIDPQQVLKPNIVIYVRDIEKMDPKLYEEGVDLITASVFRNPKKSLDPNIKSGNYLNNVMAIGEAKKKKAYDALMTNREGFVTEGPTWNVFLVQGDTYLSPPDDADILHGITRKIIREICTQNKLKLVDRPIKLEEFKKADEAFLTGSVKEILAIRSLDGSKIGSGKPGPMTLKLAQLYKNYVREYCESHP